MDEFGGIEVDQEEAVSPAMDIGAATQMFTNGQMNDRQQALYQELVNRGSVPQVPGVDVSGVTPSAIDPMAVQAVDEFGGVPVDTGDLPAVEATEPEISAWDRLSTSFSDRLSNVSDFITRQMEPQLDPLFESFGYEVEESPIKTAIRSAPVIGSVEFGQAVGAFGDVASEVVTAAGKALTPDEVGDYMKDKLADFSQTKAGQLGMKALNTGQEAWEGFEDKYPDAAITLGSMLNVLGLGVGTKGAKLTAKEIVDIGDDITTIAGKTIPSKIDKQIASTVTDDITKAIRPTVAKAKTAEQSKQYFDKANTAVQAIVENKNNLNLTDDAGDVIQGLPTNLKQFSEAINTTKKNVFKQYDELSGMAGEAGAQIDLNTIIPELNEIITHRGLQATSPDIVKYAQDMQERLSAIGTLSAKEAQDAIAALNNKLASVTDFNSAAKASVDSMIANKMRGSLDEVIEQTTGEQYSTLKKKYGALKEIERDVNRRAMVDARKNVKGLIDFTDVFTGAQTVQGILSLSPSATAAGVTGKGIASYIKNLNDPNKIIKNMFEKTEKLIQKGEKMEKPFEAKSLLGKMAKKSGKTNIMEGENVQ